MCFFLARTNKKSHTLTQSRPRLDEYSVKQNFMHKE